ncbi:hypothetical protein FSF82_021305, partial [Escherichia coli]|nr:hypothetical protein [Escherichia coli]
HRALSEHKTLSVSWSHYPDALPVVRKASWYCRQCHHDYYGEQYCTHCQTGRFSEEVVAG